MFRRLVARGGQPRGDHPVPDESGQGLAEYALILGLIAVVCVAGLTSFGQAVAQTAGFTSLPMNI